jgi:hypothetical protein
MKDIDIVFSTIKNSCLAIYYGGSRVDPVIDNPHDYDYICFAKYLGTLRLYRDLSKQGFRTSPSRRNSKSKNLNTTETSLLDFSQIRSYPYTQITWFSYLDPLMIKVIGEDVCPKTDIIQEHRAEFIKCLKEKAIELTSGRMKNQKRWYHILRSIYILINNSYDVTPDQRREINILHDLAPGYEQIRDKAIQLLKTLE